MLDNIAQTSEYDQVKSVFDPSTETYNRYRDLLKRLTRLSVAADEYSSQQLEQQDELAKGRTRIAGIYTTRGSNSSWYDGGFLLLSCSVSNSFVYDVYGSENSLCRYSDTAYRLRLEEAR